LRSAGTSQPQGKQNASMRPFQWFCAKLDRPEDR
jgi:hypothetical protein